VGSSQVEIFVGARIGAVAVVALAATALVAPNANAQAPQRPFPQHTTYTEGSIKPDNVTQAQMDLEVVGLYEQWKGAYLTQNPYAPDEYYIDYSEPFTQPPDAVTTSESTGYGMLVMAIMAGSDPQARTYFDGLYRFYRAHPSAGSPDLMAWQQADRDGAIVSVPGGGENSATDGDLDIAYALLLASEQWGEDGAIDYGGAAEAIIAAILENEVQADDPILALGDWAPGDATYGSGTRPSDWMLQHLKEFAAVTGAGGWTQIVDRAYELVDALHSDHSPATGLLPDFVVYEGGVPAPALPDYLESANDGAYGWNAARTPWRIGTDYLITGDGRAKEQLDAINGWIRSATAEDPSQIRQGYQLDGTPINPSMDAHTAFSAPFTVSAMVDPSNQSWLDELWDHNVSQPPRGYFGDSIRLLSMIVVSGNWWSPTSASAETTLEPIGTYQQPVHVTSDPVDPERLFVVERAGRIQLTTPEGASPSQFVDLTSVVVSSDSEQGLLSVAFPPDHAETGLLYVAYTGSGGTLTIAELTSDGEVADPASLRVVLTIPQPFTNHNGGQLQFGPDDYLYVSTGDGGSGGDPQGHGQDPATLLGALLRIDPRQSGTDQYTIPASNPYVDPDEHPVEGTRPEVWSWGLRNPWRFSFDRETGDLVIGDVGQGQREEIDYGPQEAGGGRGDNFGWNCREGLIAYASPSPACAMTGPFTDPVFDYSNFGSPACAITGGYVVRDPSLAELRGRYLYSDYCTGELRSIELDVPVASGDRPEGLSVPNPSSFGEDACGRIYVASLSTGVVNRLVGEAEPDCGPSPDPDTTPPVTTVLLNGGAPAPTYDGPVTATFEAADPGDAPSEVERTEYRVDSATPDDWQTYDQPTPPVVSTAGEHTIDYRSHDYAGNVEETKTVTFEITDDEPPVGEPRLRLQGKPRRRTVGPRRKRARFTFRATNVGEAPTGTVRLCASAPRRRLAIDGAACTAYQNIPADQTRERAVVVRIKPAAGGNETRIKLTARGPNVENQQTAVRLRVRR
jgi:glucose/arabinose dehydrogenase/endo-1,4-beta-D-glucanase Y